MIESPTPSKRQIAFSDKEPRGVGRIEDQDNLMSVFDPGFGVPRAATSVSGGMQLIVIDSLDSHLNSDRLTLVDKTHGNFCVCKGR